MSEEHPPTSLRRPSYAPPLPEKLHLVVVSGPDKGRRLNVESRVYVVGKDPDCDFPLSDPTISWRHLEIDLLPDGIEIRDLGSTNGSFYGGARFERIQAGVGASIAIGDTELRIEPAVRAGEEETFGRLRATSAIMKDMLTRARRAAGTDTTVLLEGETGTGKELLAEAIAQASLRRDKPFVVCDLAAIPRSLIESELFGHLRGSFTGADRDRNGAFADAHGGTLFLDEIGELDLEQQPRLLRALEARSVKPVGGSDYRKADVRVIAATNRDLEQEVRTGHFRRDLYHRLAVVRIALPPLRERREDIPALARYFLEQTASALKRRCPDIPATVMAALGSYDWPGNVRTGQRLGAAVSSSMTRVTSAANSTARSECSRYQSTASRNSARASGCKRSPGSVATSELLDLCPNLRPGHGLHHARLDVTRPALELSGEVRADLSRSEAGEHLVSDEFAFPLVEAQRLVDDLPCASHSDSLTPDLFCAHPIASSNKHIARSVFPFRSSTQASNVMPSA